ncbi:Domain in histone families 1 and 5 [Fragilaria crotonensis]|nr:Domain in histone families 1 and 5 [Fragilaria crotonensis]
MTYKEDIVAAIAELKERNGSSAIAIKKLMQSKPPKDKKWFNYTFLQALKSGVTSGDFIQLKNSYKLSADFKKASTAKPKAKAVVAKKKATATKKVSAPKKKANRDKGEDIYHQEGFGSKEEGYRPKEALCY